jgi:hypothetical protein
MYQIPALETVRGANTRETLPRRRLHFQNFLGVSIDARSLLTVSSFETDDTRILLWAYTLDEHGMD